MEQGFVCDAHKATLEYEGTSGPSSVVLKMPKDDAGSREMNAPFFALEANWFVPNAASYRPLDRLLRFGPKIRLSGACSDLCQACFNLTLRISLQGTARLLPYARSNVPPLWACLRIQETRSDFCLCSRT